MSNVTENVTKYPGVYRSKDDIANLKIRVRINEIGDNLNETKVFAWQQKVYGKFEREFYRNEKNCITALHKRYHKDVTDLLENDDVLFTYTQDDLERVGQVPGGQVSKQEFDWKEYLIHAISGPYLSDSYEVMHLVADLGGYEGDVWMKSEFVLCTLKYERDKKILIVEPDFSESEPYSIEINEDRNRVFQFYVENVSEADDTVEIEILNKMIAHQLHLRSQKVGSDFKLPSKNKLSVHLLLEILSAKDFEYDNIYIEYFIDLPPNWSCRDGCAPLRGTTAACHTKDATAHFGLPIEFNFEFDITSLGLSHFPEPPYVYFEVISKDRWNRFRTEGLAYTVLPLSQPGFCTYDLRCFRISPKGTTANLRRFFIGDCSSYNDITWIAIPKEHEGPVINKYGVDTIGTGQISLRTNVLHQSQAFSDDSSTFWREKFIFEKLNSSSLVRSVEQVVEAFKKARKRMLEARKNV